MSRKHHFKYALNQLDIELIGAPLKVRPADNPGRGNHYCTRTKCSNGVHNCDLSESSQSLKKRRTELDIENYDKIGRLFTSAYSLIKSILEYLTWSELETAAEVCQDWNEIANLIFAERHHPFWFYLEEDQSKKARTKFSFIPEKLYSRPALCIVTMNPKATLATECRMFPRDACVPYCEENHRFLQYITRFLERSDCEVLALCSTAIRCSFHVVDNTGRSWTPEILLPHIPQINAICIPNIPNVTINKFDIKKGSNFDEVYQENIGEDYELKCLLAFISFGRYDLPDQTTVLDGMFKTICQYQQTPFAFGGGIIKSIKQSRFEKAFKPYENDISCVTFSKLKNSSYDFFASSVIVWENAIDEEDIDSIFDHLSKKTVYRQHMAAFRFACISRKPQSVLELKCFQKFFPDVKMLGFEGLGELGLYIIPDDPEAVTSTKTEFVHSNTTIVVLLSWGPVAPNPIHKTDDDDLTV